MSTLIPDLLKNLSFGVRDSDVSDRDRLEARKSAYPDKTDWKEYQERGAIAQWIVGLVLDCPLYADENKFWLGDFWLKDLIIEVKFKPDPNRPLSLNAPVAESIMGMYNKSNQQISEMREFHENMERHYILWVYCPGDVYRPYVAIKTSELKSHMFTELKNRRTGEKYYKIDERRVPQEAIFKYTEEK